MVERPQVAAMLATMPYRMVDGHDTWAEGAAGLGCGTVHITPEEQAADDRALILRHESLVFVGDVRLGGRLSLAQTLGVSASEAAALTDAELAFLAYRRWGADSPEHLVGTFAFVVWDAEAQRVFCATDHMAMRPLFYSAGPWGFAVASEIKALWMYPEVPRRIDERAIGAYLQQGDPGATSRTFYRDVHKVPPASHLTWQAGEVKTHRYWELDWTSQVRFSSDEAHIEALRALFIEIMDDHVRSVTPVGVAMSGGLDSSSVACVAQDLMDARGGPAVRTYSAIFPSFTGKALEKLDERSYINAVNESRDFEVREVRADEVAPLELNEQFGPHLDQPLPSYMINIYLMWSFQGVAHQEGIRVMLDGLDGDSVLSHGWGYIHELIYTGQWGLFEDVIQALAERNGKLPGAYISRYVFPFLHGRAKAGDWGTFREAVDQLSHRYGLGKSHLWYRHGMRVRVPQRLASWLGVQQGAQKPFVGLQLMNDEFAESLGLSAKDRQWTFYTFDHPRSDRAFHYNSIEYGVWPHSTGWVEQMGAFRQQEIGHPFFDRRLIEFCFASPPHLKLQDGWTRYYMRKAMDGIIPPKVQWRLTKAELRVNVQRNVLRFHRALFDRLVGDLAPVLQPYVDLSTLERLRAAYLANPEDLSDACPIVYLYLYLQLGLWLKAEAEHATAPAPTLA